MSDGTDDRGIDPEQTTSSGDWWQGPPSQGHSGPRPTPPRPYPQPGPNPYVSAPNPRPYQSGPNPYQPSPYLSGPNPVPPVQNPYTTGPNMFPPNAPDTGRGRMWLLAGVGALVVAVVAVVATVVVMRDSGSSAAPSSSAKPTSTTRPTTTAPRTTTTGPASTLTPQIPGYQVDVPKDLKAAWDIPKDWTIDQTATNYGPGNDSMPAVGVAQEGVDYCPNNVRTTMFLTTSDIDDAASAASDTGTRAARIGYSTKTSVTAGGPQPFATTSGPLSGTFVETTGTFTAPAGCATTFSIYTLAIGVGTGKGSLVLVLLADTGVDRSVTTDFARKLLATFRLL